MSTSIVRKEAIERFGLFFDESLYVTEEYDLFMRLFIRSNVEYINEPLVIYRVHKNMSSIRFIEKYPIEHEYVIKKLKLIEPNLEETYSKEITFLKAKIGYWYARAYMSLGEKKIAREYLAPHKWKNYKFFIFYLSTFFKPDLWRIIDEIGNKVSIRFD